MTPPVFAHGQLRLYLLALLDDAPRHGYDLIRALSDRFGGTYQPSPGTIYPRLARLEEEGLVTKEENGRKSIYRITEAGKAELEARRGELAEVEVDIAETVRDRADDLRTDVRTQMSSLRADLKAQAREARSAAAGTARGTTYVPTFDPSSGVMPEFDTGPMPDAARAQWEARAQWAEPGPGVNRKALNRERLRQAEVMLSMFRAEIRAELRVAASRDELGQETVEILGRGIDDLAAKVRASMGR